jgi:FKBP-type peptidyl-prolyl cis-trans isomerase (trigger factor)
MKKKISLKDMDPETVINIDEDITMDELKEMIRKEVVKQINKQKRGSRPYKSTKY